MRLVQSIARVVSHSESAFWKHDGVSPNWVGTDPKLRQCWRGADGVSILHAILVAMAISGAPADDSCAPFRKLSLGKSGNKRISVLQDWAALGGCLRARVFAPRSL
jgi:hypothetical protein